MKTFLRIYCLIVFFCFLVSTSYCKNKSADSSLTEVATIGVYFVNVYQLDMSTNSFYADFYLWCRWQGDIDPLKNIEFSNSEEQWGFSKTSLHEKALVLKDKTFYNSLHVQGRFHHNFILNNYPFDQQNLCIKLENSIYTSTQLVYRADTVNSNFQKEITIAGWQLDKFTIDTKEHKYTTNFGLPENENNDNYSNLSFSLKLSRPVEYFFWKLLLPIIIVLLSSLGATIIYPKYVDARIYSPVGALLTTVFLQQSYSSHLPDISYLILTDKLYVIVYIAILAGILHAIYTANLVKSESQTSIQKAKRLDRTHIIIILIYLAVSSFCLVMFK